MDSQDGGEAAEEYYRENTDFGRLIFTMLEGAFFMAFNFIFYFFVALYIGERNIGDTSLIGILTALLTLGGVAFNLIYGKVFEKLQRYTGAVISVLGGLVMVILGFDVPLWLVFVLTFLVGASCGVLVSYYPMAIHQYTATAKSAFYQSVFSCIMNAAFSLTAYIPVIYMSMLACGYQKMLLWVGFTVCAVGLAVILGLKLYVEKRSA